MKLQLWRCSDCGLVFATDAAEEEERGFDQDRPCCPALTCRDNEWVDAVGDAAGYDVPFEFEAPETE